MNNKSTAKKSSASVSSRPQRSIQRNGQSARPKKTYSNMSYRRRTKKEERERKHAEDLATLPKNPVKRFFAHLHPKRVFKYWFSRRGLMMILKIIGVFVLLCAIAVGGLFLYFKKDLAAIRPEELANRVNGTVNTYLDRNGIVLWEDKGDGDYRLVVDGDEISMYMRQATVAAEDRSFYSHIGVDFKGLTRAAINTLTGKQVQGGSTLTQQLIKQVYFSDESADRTMSGIPRKIKETILAIEIERMYDKEQIITMYLNESPYGGRRNGVESGARTYFGKAAKDLTLSEAAFLAAIPQNPYVFNPYNDAGHERLIGRQHYILDAMAELGYVTAAEVKTAKEDPILDRILPETSQYRDIKAPHFVLEVKKLLEEQYGVRTMRAGGFTITTTLDYRAQLIALDAVAAGAGVINKNRFPMDNISLSSVDVETGQVIAMVGSINWDQPGYGQTNASTSPLEPGSTIKPVLDYAPLFMQREGQNFGPGSILRDENINYLYCAGNTSGKCSLNNYSGRFNGNVTIRTSLASSLNIPAVKAFYITGADLAVETNQKMGNLNWCSNGEYRSLAISIGQGCTVLPIEHANTYATFGRGGVYKPLTYWLEIKNSTGDIIDRWIDGPGERAIDEQVAYMISDILSDPEARKLGFGSRYDHTGVIIPGVWTAVKTGTTDAGNGYAKDNWTAMYSASVATTVWSGNHDGTPWRDNNSNMTSFVPRTTMDVYMKRIHSEVYGPDGKWTSGMKPSRPSGMQELTVNGRKDIWPSWYNTKTSGTEKVKMTFDTFTKKKATNCTPPETRIEVEIYKSIDPISKKEIWTTNGYDKDEEDSVHKCDDIRPSIVNINYVSGSREVRFRVNDGTYPVSSISVTDGTNPLSYNIVGSQYIVELPDGVNSIVITVIDDVGYRASETVPTPSGTP